MSMLVDFLSGPLLNDSDLYFMVHSFCPTSETPLQ